MSSMASVTSMVITAVEFERQENELDEPESKGLVDSRDGRSHVVP